MFDLVVRQGIARLTLARPEARNAIPAAGWVQLGAALEEVSRSGARVLLLAGTGDSFCAGADVRDFKAMAGDPGRAASFRLAMRAALDRLRRLPIASVAVVDGACFGAGVALAIACDLRLSGERASFAITPAKLGLSYPQEDVHRLVSLVGPGQAARLLFSARAIDGPEAARIGLVERHAGTGLVAAVDSLVGALAESSAESIAGLKRAIRLAGEGAATDAEQDRRFDAMLGSAEAAERLSAMRRGRGR